VRAVACWASPVFARPWSHGTLAFMTLTPWLTALHKLCVTFGWSDRLAGRTLSALTLPAIEYLNGHNWLMEDIERLADECGEGFHSGPRQIFSRRRVWLLRQANGIERPTPRVCVYSKSPETAQRAYQSAAGWGHLLPDEEGNGVILRKRAVDILSVLKEATTPMTRAEIASVLGMAGAKLFQSNGRSNLAHLVRLGLVLSSPSPRRPARWLYSIAPAALPAESSLISTAVERKYG